MSKVIVAALIVVVAIVLYVGTSVIPVYALQILVNFDEEFNTVFLPSFAIHQLPRYQLWTYTSTPALKSYYDVWSAESLYLDVNVSAWNVNNTLFFTGRFTIDTLAEHKVTFYREYEAGAYTKQLTLKLDCYLFVDQADNNTDIERSWSRQWELVIP